MQFRLINSGKLSPAMNMAIDEALLDGPQPVLRFYQWQPAGISIGFFQKMKEEINIAECKKQGIGYVRRLTGGKAVLHDMELTYSIILDEKTMPKSIIESYKIISQGILIALEKLGFKAQMKESLEKKPSSSICFNESSYYEIIVGNKKIVGSAQTRKKGKLLQHGSVLIDIDINKLCSLFNSDSEQTRKETGKRITSLKKELRREITFEEVAEAMTFGFQTNFECEFRIDNLTKQEFLLAEKLAEKKYSTDEWNFMR